MSEGDPAGAPRVSTRARANANANANGPGDAMEEVDEDKLERAPHNRDQEEAGGPGRCLTWKESEIAARPSYNELAERHDDQDGRFAGAEVGGEMEREGGRCVEDREVSMGEENRGGSTPSEMLRAGELELSTPTRQRTSARSADRRQDSGTRDDGGLEQKLVGGWSINEEDRGEERRAKGEGRAAAGGLAGERRRDRGE